MAPPRPDVYLVAVGPASTEELQSGQIYGSSESGQIAVTIG